MKCKKAMVLLLLVVFLLGIACVSASDVNDTLVPSENSDKTILSLNNEITYDDLEISEENNTLTKTNNDENLAVDESTYSELAREIGSGGNKILTHEYYTYDSGSIINISVENSIIDGNGAVIDMAGAKMGAFYVDASGVTIKNLTIKNAIYKGYGGAIYFSGSGTVTNCNFTKNSCENGGAVYFNGSGEVKNCIFTNNSGKYGGALYFNSDGEVKNCIFTGNNATTIGGAISMASGTVSNCNFTKNRANNGGAVWINSGIVTNSIFTANKVLTDGGAVRIESGIVSNCNFINNSATASGGAVYTWYDSCNVTNCQFAGNSAYKGGAICGEQLMPSTVDTCIFKTQTDTTENAIIFPPTLNVDNFTTIYGSGEKLTLDLTTHSGIPVTNGNISISVYFKNNDSWVGNYDCLSGEGWIPDLPIGTYYAIFNMEYAGFQPINRTITVSNVKYYINVTSVTTNNKTVNITAESNIPKDIASEGKLLFILPDSTEIYATYVTNGTWWAVHTFDDYADYQVNATYVGLDDVTITNATISISKTPTEITVENATVELFVGDSVGTGATLTPANAGSLAFTSSNITVVKVEEGKIIAVGEGSATITVSFAGSDDYAAADDKTIRVTVSLKDASVSVNNSTLELLVGGNFTIVPTTAPEGLNVTFVPDNSGVCSVDENGLVTALKNGTGSVTVKVCGNDGYAENFTVISVTVSKIPTEIAVKNATVELLVGNFIDAEVSLTPADAGSLSFTSNNMSVAKVEGGKIIAVGEGSAIITVSFAGNDKYEAAENKTISVTVKAKYESNVTISPIDSVVYPNNVTIKYSIENRTNVTVSIDGVSDDKIIITNDTVTVSGLNAGEYTITIINSENSTHSQSSATMKFTVNKQKTSITASAVTATYNKNKVLVITLKDANGKALANAKVTVALGKTKTYTTNKNGQIKISTKGLKPKKYTAKITFNGNTNYAKSTKNVKVTVKKATPKIKAKKKTFKKSKKVKKYKIVLKNNVGKAIKKAKVTIKIGKKTFKAKTNSKGKATFKIKKLTKKGKYKAKITYKGNAYYNKVTKKVKIKIK